MWSAHHTACTVFSRTSLLDPEQDFHDEKDEKELDMSWTANEPYETVSLELGAAATGCFGDWATWSARPSGWVDNRNGGVWTES